MTFFKIDLFSKHTILCIPKCNILICFLGGTNYSLNRHWYSLGVLPPSLQSQNGRILGPSVSSPLSRADLTENKGMTQFLTCSLRTFQVSKGILLLKNRHGSTLIGYRYSYHEGNRNFVTEPSGSRLLQSSQHHLRCHLQMSQKISDFRIHTVLVVHRHVSKSNIHDSYQ